MSRDTNVNRSSISAGGNVIIGDTLDRGATLFYCERCQKKYNTLNHPIVPCKVCGTDLCEFCADRHNKLCRECEFDITKEENKTERIALLFSIVFAVMGGITMAQKDYHSLKLSNVFGMSIIWWVFLMIFFVFKKEVYYFLCCLITFWFLNFIFDFF